MAQVLQISGYIANEKVHIARNYLEPQTRGEAGVKEGSSTLTDQALVKLITEYCRKEPLLLHYDPLERLMHKL